MLTISSKVKPPLAARPQRAHPLADGLAGGWLLNEGTGLVVHDLSGHRQEGSFSGAPAWQPGPFGRVVAFDGNDDWISMGDCLDLGTDDVTLLVMLRYSAAQQPDEWAGDHFAALAGKGYLDSTAAGYGLCLANNRLIWQVRNLDTVFEAGSDGVWNDGRWHTVIGVCDRDSSIGVRLYVNGVRQDATADPTALNGVNLQGAQAFALGSRQSEVTGTWWADFLGQIGAVFVWRRVLREAQIRELQCDPFALFARGRTFAGPALPTGNIVDLAGSLHGTSSASATLQAIRGLSGACVTSTSLLGRLRKAGPRKLQDDRPWQREALFHSVTSVAYRLGTALTQGWFWVRRSGCAGVSCGEDLVEAKMGPLLRAAGPEVVEIVLPAHLSPEPGSTRCYLVRRFNGSGYQEQTTAAAVMVRVGPDGQLAPPVPNAVFNLQGKLMGNRKLRLSWFYDPLDQEAAPQEFHLYGDGATGQVDLEHPIATILYQGRRFYQYETGPLDEGSYTFVVRPHSAGQAESLSSATIVCQVTTLLPEAATILSAQAI